MNELIPAIGLAVSGVKSLLEMSSGIKNSELKRIIAELNEQLANIKNDVAALLRENSKLKERLDKMKNYKKNPLAVNTQDWLYYDTKNDGPFCTRCYDKDNERIRVFAPTKTCPECNFYFGERAIGAYVARPHGRKSLPKI